MQKDEGHGKKRRAKRGRGASKQKENQDTNGNYTQQDAACTAVQLASSASRPHVPLQVTDPPSELREVQNAACAGQMPCAQPARCAIMLHWYCC